MAFNSTVLSISTTPTDILTTATTWANTRGATLYDPTPFSAFNDSVLRVWIGGTSALTTGNGMPILSSGYLNASLLQSDPLFAVTTASTATLRVSAGRQG